MSCVLRIVLLCWCALAPLGVRAHSGSASYVHIVERDAALEISVALDLRDVEYVIGVDTNADQAITWGELSSRQAVLASYIAEHLALSRRGRGCDIAFAELQVDALDDGVYAVSTGSASCPRDGASVLESTLLFEFDADHRSLVEWRRGSAQSLAVLTNSQRTARAPGEDSSHLTQLIQFATEGMWHIWSGLDHLAFLLILLLPAAIARGSPSSSFDWRKLVAIVTAFTIAHSVTLALAVARVVALPERAVEIAIAASVVVAALTNLWARARAIGVPTAFLFGLLHGFGFASALRGLDASPESLALALFGFNLGVEAGQLIVVAAVLPLLLIVRASSFYAARIVPATSLIVAIIGAVWVWERALP